MFPRRVLITIFWLVLTCSPALAGQASTAYGYLYTGGPCTGWTRYNESSSPVAYATYGRDANGFVTNVSGTVTPVSYLYDADYRLKEIVDGEYNETSYHYNAQGYLYQVYYPGVAHGHSDGANSPGSADTISYTSYDDDGNPLTRVDGNDVTTSYTYNDPESLLTNVSYNDGKTPSVTLGYDGYGRMDSIADGTGSTSYTLDDDDNVNEKDVDFTGLGTKKLIYSYYPDGSRSSMNTPAGSFSYQYDAAQRLVSLTNPYDQTTSWSYYDNNWLETQTLSPGSVTTYTPDQWGELTSLVNASSTGTVLSEYTGMTYDGLGNLTSMTASIPTKTQYDGTTSYTYDSVASGTRGQLAEETSTRDGDYTENFAYDGGTDSATVGVGNPTTSRTSTFTFNGDNQITSTGYSYDGNGNPTTYAGNSLSFDAENHLTGVAADDFSAAYNGMGQRAEKNDSGGPLYYLYDGDDPVVEINSSNGVAWTNTFGVAGPVSQHTSGEDRYFTWDPQGNIATELNGTGAVSSPNMFDGFGLRDPGTPWPGQFSYGGQSGYYTDTSTGLILCGNRYYDPGVGRWLTRDPIGNWGGDNLYRYVGNNPLNLTDPLGLMDQNNPFQKAWGWYMNGMSGTSDFADHWLMNDSVGGLGTATGNYDSGCGSGWGVALAAGNVGLNAAMLLAPGGEEAEAGVDVARGAEDVCEHGCFIAGTPVQMADGTTKPIQNVQAGDWVKSRDPKTGKTEAKQVLRTYVHQETSVLTLKLSTGDSITCTKEHPFYVPGEGFVVAGNLSVGTRVVTRAGSAIQVTGISLQKELEGGYTVYNFEVQDDHTYFVGKRDGGVWVHNDCWAANLTQKLKPLTTSQALDRIRNGGDIIAESRSEAKGLAKAASGTNGAIGPEIHGDPGDGFMPHFHPDPRNGSHIFYP